METLARLDHLIYSPRQRRLRRPSHRMLPGVGPTNSTYFQGMWYAICNRGLQNTEATASTAKRQMTLLALTTWQSDSLIVNNIVNTGRLVNLNTLGNNETVICSESHFLPDVLAPLCANSIFNCEKIEPASRPSAMLGRVNSVHPEAESAIAI